ncbi:MULTISPECIES: SCO family protein [Wolbachia]|uniref:SCO family protein n=1 Tax=Wolbachia TaxID=953 RepID=UPI001BA9D2BC|nr:MULTISPECIES: SCO family protein [unclassified Wolbachia]QUI60208.1 SCO family protein [Wolbachia endosymbiont of Spodoptera picta]URG40226.1 SCO family protein [Wolbachia endosymbiont of Ostrinia furnacalis]URG41250.1 SCO family protein [Wolbachia endosymbiont of Ostrinia scapulalis]
MVKSIRLLSSLLIALAAVFLGYCYFTKKGIFVPYNTEIKIGGDFSLINQDGQIVRSSDFKDKYMMIFFGFSSCKRICPMNLGIISETLAKLDEKTNNKLQTFFITVDPERDDTESLKEFQQQFDHRIQMLTGERQKIDEVVAKYKVYASKVGGEEEINHSSIIYLIGPEGKYVTHFVADLNSDESQSDKILAEIKKYVS